MSKHILTVDDSVSMRQMIRFTLAQAGFTVTEAVDGVEAIEKLNGPAVNMMITDLNMPRMDGLELIKKVRALPHCRFMPIVMLTTESNETSKQQGRTAGASGWIVKPFKAEQLVAVVKKLLG